MPARLAQRVVAGLAIASWLLANAERLEASTPVFASAAALTADATTDSGNDSAPRIVSDGRGTWLTIWAATAGSGGRLGADSDVVAARSRDLGVSWTAPAPVNATAATDVAFDFAPALATDGRGLWVAVWVATNGPDTDVFVARSTDLGATWSTQQPLHADAGTDVGNDDHPQIATDGSGTWIVVWDANGRTGNDRDVFVARSTDGGVTWSTPAAIAANAATDRGTDQRPQLAADGTGRWVVVWASNDTLGATKGNDFDVLTVRSEDGGITWSPTALLNGNATTDRGLDDRPQIATDRNGTWVAAWVSDENLGGMLGPDLDVLTARSLDGGVTWSAPSALNANAASDTGEDGAPVLATDGAGTWVALWESTDSLGDTIGSDYDILMAHSIDGGAHWSTPHAIDPEAASDGRRDLAPQLATAGGVWNAVWSASGGTLGSDTDVLRAGGRERCGNGTVDPGEECDDGNTRSGDACPASCEFPPPPPTPVTGATPGPGGGSPGSGGATATPGADGSTPDGGEGGAATPTPNGDGSPTPSSGDASGTPSTANASATPSTGATSTPSGGAAGPTVGASGAATPTPTIDPVATATPTPRGSGVAATATAHPSGGVTPTAPSTPRPGTTEFAGSLVGTARAKGAVACQRALLKAGAQVVGARLTKLGSCGRAVQRCIQTAPDDPACLGKASARCRSAVTGFVGVDAKQAAAVRKRCSGALALADVLAPAGLGYGALACDDGAASDSLDDLATCVVGEHACRGAALFELLQPRAKELMRLPGMNAATLDTIVCLPDHGGDGAAVGDPAGEGKAVESCAAAIVKSGTSFVKKRLARMAKCADALFTCVQLKPGDGACLAKARARCDAGHVTSAAEERTLARSVTNRCREDVVAYATLRAARAANLDALASACAAVGVPELATLADYQQCVVRADACRIDGVLAVQAPRLAELLALVGRPFGSGQCPAR